MPEKTQSSGPALIVEVHDGIPTSGIDNLNFSTATVSYQNHDLSQLGHGDCGGPFWLHRTRSTPGYGKCYAGRFKGSTVRPRPVNNLSPASEPLKSTMWGQGGTAISRCLPAQPAFDSGSFLAETLLGGVPKAIGAHLWRERVKDIRAVGKEYLNYEFGWAPLVRDVKDFCHAVSHANKTLKSLAAGNGKKTRTGYAFPTTSSSSTTSSGFLYSLNSSVTGMATGGKYNGTYESTSRTWFKGCFNYNIPVDPRTQQLADDFASKADHVLGLRLTPEVLWNAAPWSWAIDYAINAGDIMKNVSAFSHDGLTLQYGYIMTHSYSQQYLEFSGGTVCTPCSLTRIDEWKKRYPASPYGFGLTYDGLTTSQKTVLGAIGITHF